MLIYRHGIRQEHIEVIDIADNEKLLEKYALKIPVVKAAGNGAELAWPFSQEELDRWCKAL